MRDQGLAGLVIFHTHPLSDNSVAFSLYDDSQEPLLFQNLVDIAPETKLISVVSGKSALCGRFWQKPGGRQGLDNLVVVGESLVFVPLNGRQPPPAPPAAAIFDRGLAITGQGALARLQTLKFAVVGASGTGSLICELLLRAGATWIMPIDDDVTKLENLNRILYSKTTDAANATPKVDLLKREMSATGLGCHVEPIRGNILDAHVLARLRECDVIFGCVDKAYPRLVLSQFAHQFLTPYIDIGTEIGASAEGIVSLNSRTSYVAPGRRCLVCSGIVTPRQLSFESLSAAERKRVGGQGYSDDLLLTQPAVMDLNMRAASYGMMVLRHLLQPFLLTPLPVTISENLVTYTTLPIQEARANNPTCRICQMNPHQGFGNCGPSIGLEGTQLAAII
jgi:hypothetical protein